MSKPRKLISIILVACLICTAMCFNAVATADSSNGYRSNNIWQPVAFVSQEILDMGYTGGEGCQWMTYITMDHDDGNLAFATVDVGGLVKSTDGGKTWAQSTIGIKSEGTTGVEIDPTNDDRVIVIGGSSAKGNTGGLYMSTNEGDSWSYKITNMSIHGCRDFRRQVAFDTTSYDEKLNGCKVIYWVTEESDLITKGIYKSTDGGETWNYITGSDIYANSNIAVHPNTGDVYVSNQNGLYKSTNGGTTFSLTSLTVSINYLATSVAEPNKIYITATDDMYVYNTDSDTATKMNAVGYPTYATFISVSPVNPNKMVLQSDYITNEKQYINKNYYSIDGGATWSEATLDKSGSFMPFNPRQNPSAFHPTDENIVIKLGGDCIMRSEDGGKSYKVSNDGNNAICVGGMFNFNLNNPNLISISSQDYNGGFSVDGGKTWTYLNWSGYNWGGHAYGAYIIDENTMVAGVSDSWSGDRILTVTYDGGKTFTNTGIVVGGYDIGMGVPGDNNIVFFSDYRSADAAKTWTKMNGCTAVFTASNDGSMIFGMNGNNVVISYDKGVTWSTLYASQNSISDVAYNPKTGCAYVVSDNALYAVNVDTKAVTQKGFGSKYIKSIAVDPNNGDIMYAACKDYTNYSNDSAMRSVDGGETWTCINRSANDGNLGPDGGRASSFVRVNAFGEAWFVTHCRGLWKMPSPVSAVVGDIDENSFINATDYLYIKAHVLDTIQLNSKQTQLADFNGDNKIDSQDALALKQQLLGII